MAHHDICCAGMALLATDLWTVSWLLENKAELFRVMIVPASCFKHLLDIKPNWLKMLHWCIHGLAYNMRCCVSCGP